jgi:hypothetical protein
VNYLPLLSVWHLEQRLKARHSPRLVDAKVLHLRCGNTSGVHNTQQMLDAGMEERHKPYLAMAGSGAVPTSAEAWTKLGDRFAMLNPVVCAGEVLTGELTRAKREAQNAHEEGLKTEHFEKLFQRVMTRALQVMDSSLFEVKERRACDITLGELVIESIDEVLDAGVSAVRAAGAKLEEAKYPRGRGGRGGGGRGKGGAQAAQHSDESANAGNGGPTGDGPLERAVQAQSRPHRRNVVTVENINSLRVAQAEQGWLVSRVEGEVLWVPLLGVLGVRGRAGNRLPSGHRLWFSLLPLP